MLTHVGRQIYYITFQRTTDLDGLYRFCDGPVSMLPDDHIEDLVLGRCFCIVDPGAFHIIVDTAFCPGNAYRRMKYGGHPDAACAGEDKPETVEKLYKESSVWLGVMKE